MPKIITNPYGGEVVPSSNREDYISRELSNPTHLDNDDIIAWLCREFDHTDTDISQVFAMRAQYPNFDKRCTATGFYINYRDYGDTAISFHRTQYTDNQNKIYLTNRLHIKSKNSNSARHNKMINFTYKFSKYGKFKIYLNNKNGNGDLMESKDWAMIRLLASFITENAPDYLKERYYTQKYLKYKSKYLKLKKSLELN
tara:strand:- start:1246 stop:1842 length:597 start_codon:yes stop_codon:yes gene_type:complete